MSHLDHIRPLDLDRHDAALKRCIDACWHEGVVDAGSVISMGVGLIAWGLAIYARDHGRRDLPGLRRAAMEAVFEAGIVDLRPEAAA